MNKAFISGILGQDGSYLAGLLLTKGYKVYGSDIKGATDWRHRELGIKGKIEKIYIDIAGFEKIKKIFSFIMPDEVYNLGSQSFVLDSFYSPLTTFERDAMETARLLEAIRQVNPSIRFFQASSALIFGKNGPGPDGAGLYLPESPYACAKLYSHWLTATYRRIYGMFACSGILFNHESPLRSEQFVTRKISIAVAEIKLGLRSKLTVGNLDSKRDWGYALDYVEAMRRMLRQKEPRDYVLATGKIRSVRQFIEEAFKNMGCRIVWRGRGLNEKGLDADTGRLLVDISAKYYRRSDEKSLTGNPSQAEKILGWKPQVDFKKLVSIMVHADIKRLKCK
ncbi:MAG: GDP-mannose 4,6-dehydratase [Elusimicrobia bacterium]|nr:GDP-mannose 4,6-dehydratase [Elusimicrobiota bacterium]